MLIRIAVVAALLVGLPLMSSPYQIYVIDTILVACIGALGLNLLTGYTGLISIGHGGFLGIGAFTSALLVSRLGVPFWVSVPTAGLLTAVIGLIVGLPSLRIKGMYLAIATLAAQVIIEWALARPAIAGGGAIAAPRPDMLHDDRAYYLVLLAVTVAAVVLARNVLRTRIGRAMLAVRDREIAAAVIGIDVGRYKLLAFGLSSFYAGIAGALLGHLGRAVSYEQFQIDLSIQYLAMIVIGGLGSIRGSILGAVFISLMPLVLRNGVAMFEGVLPGSTAIVLSSTQTFLFGLVIVAFMVFQSRGLARLRVQAVAQPYRRLLSLGARWMPERPGRHIGERAVRSP